MVTVTIEQAIDSVVECPTKRVFDWDYAAEIIRANHILNAEAFLRDDESFTSGRILDDGQPILDHEGYLETYDDIPTLRDMDSREEYACYKEVKSTNWSITALQKLGEC